MKHNPFAENATMLNLIHELTKLPSLARGVLLKSVEGFFVSRCRELTKKARIWMAARIRPRFAPEQQGEIGLILSEIARCRHSVQQSFKIRDCHS